MTSRPHVTTMHHGTTVHHVTTAHHTSCGFQLLQRLSIGLSCPHPCTYCELGNTDLKHVTTDGRRKSLNVLQKVFKYSNPNVIYYFSSEPDPF